MRGTAAIALLAMAVFLAARFARDHVWAAPREVVPGSLVRSGQLSTDELAAVLDRFGVTRVVSLRKIDPPAPELRAEIEFLAARGIEHRNVSLSPTRLPKPAALVDLLEAFQGAPGTILVHCEEGVDRTGLATVVWLVVHGHRTLADARREQLSWRNGHVAFGQAHAMDDFFELYERDARGEDLARWIRESYPRVHARATDTAEPTAATRHELAQGVSAP